MTTQYTNKLIYTHKKNSLQYFFTLSNSFYSKMGCEKNYCNIVQDILFYKYIIYILYLLEVYMDSISESIRVHKSFFYAEIDKVIVEKSILGKI
ncbi:hypothetical protein BpHYR1_051221 [Brachionus plicatilis]|uniref:Uncharacterized protein n=1 Tax=Brachionus plicatilis TaxID=10195 RepID=A0A3M7SX83_BRAPC|nr:hypothetical protein BpHYR1_051221 [Brachionus plicatilis]